MNVTSFDLNHARALHYLLEEAHVARAAHRLGITPAAASNALRRLRVDFDDPLLLRSGRTLVRTPRAEALRDDAKAIVQAAERLLEQGAPFDPETARWEIVLTTSDRVAELLLPTLDRLVARRAPQAQLTVRTVTVGVEAFLRDHGGVAIVAEFAKEGDLRTEPLFVDDFVCAMRKGHPVATGRWTLKRFAQQEHVLVAPQARSGRGVVDALLERHGLTRQITRVVTTFSLALPLLVDSERIAVLPRSFTQRHARSLGLVVRPVPLTMKPFEMLLVWHAGRERDPKHVWLRGLVHDAVRTAALPRP
jgi:DNA-binding transcriptional LysR family regulator